LPVTALYKKLKCVQRKEWGRRGIGGLSNGASGGVLVEGVELPNNM